MYTGISFAFLDTCATAVSVFRSSHSSILNTVGVIIYRFESSQSMNNERFSARFGIRKGRILRPR